MGEINLSNSAERDAVVTAENVIPTRQVRWLDPGGRQARGVRLVKSTTRHDIDALLAVHGDLSAVSEALVDGDPELDFENAGRFLTETKENLHPDNKKKKLTIF